MPQAAPPRLQSIHHFRGITILFIVANHCYWSSGWPARTFIEKMFVNLLQNWSVMFVFISGFLFHHVFYPRFRNNRNYFPAFIASKIRNVLLPYLILSSLPIIYFVFLEKGAVFQGHLFHPQPGMMGEYVKSIASYYLTGKTFVPYWYIPFIMAIFALSPLFVRFIGLPAKTRLVITSVFFIIALFIHRPVANLLVTQSVLYFTPVYLAGIMVSIHREKIYALFKNKEWVLLGGALLLSAMQLLLYHHYVAFQKPPLMFTGPDILLIQKCVLTLFFIVCLHRFEDKNWTVISFTASASFAVYFLHPIFLKALSYMRYQWNLQNVIPENVTFVFLTVGALVFSLTAAFITKSLLKSRSRMIIGY